MFLIQAILSCVSSKFRESYKPPAFQIRVKQPGAYMPTKIM